MSEHVQFKRKDGSTYDALLTLTAVQYKGQHATQALVEDITARMEMERSLVEEQTRFRVLIENNMDGTALYIQRKPTSFTRALRSPASLATSLTNCTT